MNGNNEAKALTTANWIQIVVAASIIVGGFWVLITSQFDSKVKPLEEKVIALSNDKSELAKQIADANSQYAKLYAEIAADHSERKAKEIELETQFDADAQLRNVQFSDQQRLNCIIWEHIPVLGNYPTGLIISRIF